MKKNNIPALIKVIISSAFYSNNCDPINDPYLDYLGLGKIVYSKIMREGVKDIIDLISENASLKQSKEYLQDSLDTYREISEEIIDENDFELLTDEEKVKIKTYIDNILEKDNEKENK